MIRSLVLALLAATLPGAATEIGAAALDSLPHANVYVLGEVHDNPVHHRNQARAVEALGPAALVFEMLTPDQASRVTAENRDDAQAMGKALDWQASGWPDFAMYHPIFTAAPQATIHGAALPRDEAQRLFGRPAADAFGPDAERFGLDQPLPAPEQTRREATQMADHCNALPEELLPDMVTIQRLRDARLAQVALEALRATGGPVAVITGTGHARTDQGVPLKLARAAPDVRVLALGQLESAPLDPAPFDLWIVTDPADRPDPCDAFHQGNPGEN